MTIFWRKKLFNELYKLRLEIMQNHETFNALSRLTNEHRIQTEEYISEVRKGRGLTFKAEHFGMKPEYGKDWEKEENELNQEKDKK